MSLTPTEFALCVAIGTSILFTIALWMHLSEVENEVASLRGRLESVEKYGTYRNNEDGCELRGDVNALAARLGYKRPAGNQHQPRWEASPPAQHLPEYRKGPK